MPSSYPQPVPSYPQPMAAPMPQQMTPQQHQAPPHPQTQPNACTTCNQNNPGQHVANGQNPNEKHIYYGPNGEVLPGPPAGFNSNSGMDFNQFPDDFAIEGVLQHGRLAHMSLVEARRGFPKIPDFLIRDLLEKYGQYERTIVRIVMQGGQAYVHATPDMPTAMPMQDSPRFQTEYVPVYLEEGEEFDYDKFYSNYQNQRYGQRGLGQYNHQGPPRRYRSPSGIPRSFPIIERDYQRERRRSPDIRPDTTDPAAHLRWKKERNGRGVNTAPSFPVPPPTSDSFISTYRDSYRDRNKTSKKGRSRDRTRDRDRNWDDRF